MGRDPATGNVLYRINRSCGNVTGDINTPLPPIPDTFNPVPSASDPQLFDNAGNKNIEAPTKVSFSWSIAIGTSRTINNLPVTTQYYIHYKDDSTSYITPPTTSPYKIIGPSTTQNTAQLTIPGPPLVVGDKVCVIVTTPDTVTISDTGDVTAQSGAKSTFPPEICSPVVALPYMTMYGNDVFAGGALDVGTTCGPTSSANILAFLTGANLNQGASAQFAVYATKDIPTFNGFGLASAKLRSGAPTAKPPNGLTLSSTPLANPGHYANAACNDANYAFSPSGLSLPSTDLSSYAAHTTATYQTGSVTVNAGPTTLVSTGVHLLIYVSGDLTINGNITYDTTSWNSPTDIPSITFLVQGNINIDSSVTKLDGNYIAEQQTTGDVPTGQSTASGAIFTCTNGIGYFALDQLFTNCDKQLIVHGRLLANAIFWLRAYSTRAKGTSGENPYSGPNPNSAELVISGPEGYVALPTGLKPDPLEAITSLPPIL